jgi:hypothetical protein
VIAEAVPVDASQYTAQYELLRSQVIGARCRVARPDVVCEPCGVGLALLLREGIPGWLKALETVIRASAAVHTPEAMASAQSRHSAGYTCAPAWFSGVPRRDLTTLLTSLVLSTRPVEHPSPREGYQSCH